MNKCCICNTPIDNKYEQCLECNYKIINFMNYDMNCHLKPKQIIKSYENKITEIVKTENFNDKQTKCIELIGLARFLTEEYDNELEVVRNASRLFLTKMKYIEYIYNYNMFDDIVIDLEME